MCRDCRNLSLHLSSVHPSLREMFKWSYNSNFTPITCTFDDSHNKNEETRRALNLHKARYAAGAGRAD